MKKSDIILERVGQTLIPHSHADAVLLESDYPQGKPLRAKITMARSVPFNSRYWAILAKCMDHLDDDQLRHYPTKEKVHKALLMSLGYTETVWQFNGRPVVVADSSAFDKMSAATFKQYHEAAMIKLGEWLGFDPEQLL